MADYLSTSNTLLLVFSLLFVTACSQEVANTPTSPAPEAIKQASSSVVSQEPGLKNIPRPNPDAMQDEVAALLSKSWDQLNLSLSDNNLSREDRAKAFADYGLVAFGNGLVLPAEIAFENARQTTPNDVRWVYFLALVHDYTGNLEQAASNFEQVLDLRADDLPTLIRLGNVRFEQAQLKQAREIFLTALKVKADSAASLYGLGRIANAEEKYADAVKYFEKALALQPDANRINYLLGMSWRNLGERDKAKQSLASRGSNEPSFADPLFDEISGGETRISGLWAHMSAGSQAFVDGNYKLAVEEFTLATVDHPDDPRSWQSLGMSLKNIGSYEQAEQAYQKALELSDDNAVIQHELANLLLLSGQNQDAEKHLRQAIKIDPRMLSAHSSLARLLSKTNRPDEALLAWENALELDPQSGELAIARAEVLLALDRSDEAVQALATTIGNTPQDTNVRIAYGVMLTSVGRLNEAVTEIDQAISTASTDNMRGRAHYARGQIYLQEGQADSALISFGEALKLIPQYRAAALELARTFIRIRDLKQALGTYQVFLKNWPDDDGARVEAAKVAVMLGDGANAKDILELGAKRPTASARLMGTLARLLVLSTESDVRNPDLAFEYARRALSLSEQPQHTETLALCQAAKGSYAQATTTQEELLKTSGAAAAPRARTRMEKNLQRYRSRTLGRLPFDAS